MELIRLTENCWYTDSDQTADRPSFGYILGPGGNALAVDSGNSAKHYGQFCDLLREHGFPMPDYCIITHWHWDHTLGIRAVSVPVIACEATQKHLREMAAWTDEDKRAFWLSNEYCRVEYSDSSLMDPGIADIVFKSEIEIDLAGLTVKGIHVGGPHSEDSVLVYVPQDGMIYAGDSNAGNFSLPNIAYDQELLAEYTDKVLSMDFNCFLHSHRQPLDRAGTEQFLLEAKERGYYTF